MLIIPDFHSEEDDGTYLCMAIQEPNIDSREINVTGYCTLRFLSLIFLFGALGKLDVEVTALRKNFPKSKTSEAFYP